MSIGVGVYLASYLQNRSEHFSDKKNESLSRQGWFAAQRLKENEMLNMTEISEEPRLSGWKAVYDSYSGSSHEREEDSFVSENNLDVGNNKTEFSRNTASKSFLASIAGKKTLMRRLKSDRFLMVSKLQNHSGDVPRQNVSSVPMLNVPINENISVSKSAKEWMELFEHAQGNMEFMSYASDNFETRASKHKKSRIPTAHNDGFVKGKYDAYKFFSVSNVEKMMKNNYRPEEAVRTLDMAL